MSSAISSTDAEGPAPGRDESSTGEVDARERMVRAALEVFLEKGYDGTRVQDIAERAGYTAGALYVHFPNRSTLLSEAIVLEGSRVLAEMIAGLDKVGAGEGRPGEGKIAHVMTEQAVLETTNLDLLLVEALALAARDATAREELSETLGGLDQLITRQCERAVAMGNLDPGIDHEAMTAFFTAWIMGLFVQRAIRRPRPDATAYFSLVERMTSSFAPPE